MVVICLEVVEVGVDHCEPRGRVADEAVELEADLEVARQPGERRDLPHLPAAPERGRHSGDELGRVEGLGDVVVGARGEPEDLLGGERLGGQHDDRRVGGPGVVAQPLAHLVAVQARHHHVEQDEVGLEPQRCRQGALAVVLEVDLVTLEGEVDLDVTGDVAVGHGRAPMRPRESCGPPPEDRRHRRWRCRPRTPTRPRLPPAERCPRRSRRRPRSAGRARGGRSRASPRSPSAGPRP